MSSSISQQVDGFKALVKRTQQYQEAVALMYWDLRTGAPKKGVPLRSESIGMLSGEAFKLTTSVEMEQYLNALEDASVQDGLDDITKASVREVRKEFNRSRKIPQERYEAYVVLTSQAESAWEEARHTNNFEHFRPYLEKIVAMNIEFVGYWGYTDNKYDTLLDMYEPGMTVRVLDQIFHGLRDETVQLVRAIQASSVKAQTSPYLQHFDKSKQRDLSIHLLKLIGYDFEAGRLDETVHPFMTTINRFDNRVTTKYLLDDVRSAIFSTVHEGGHALYEQGVSTDLVGTPLSGGTSMGIHESQSRFYENMIGRSREFWEANFGTVQQLFPEQLRDVRLDDFYLAVNDVEPSLIRIEADEVTYNLHIMLRYELEKGLINETIRVCDLPELWREKMRDYLGVVPETDADGVLQDVHWSGGSFGYFPSYALGNIYAAQFRNTLAKEIPNYLEEVRQGNMLEIKAWLNEKIHKHGKMLSPAEIVKHVTGEQIDSKYLVQYFREKFGPLYQL